MPEERVAPRTFYLNEQHELSRAEKAGGGRTPQFLGIDWATKGRTIHTSLSGVKQAYRASRDPLAQRHYFALAKPTPTLRRRSTDKRRAPEGEIEETIVFAKDDSRVFRRLGIDLVQVADTGEAIVHMQPERLDQLLSTTQLLGRVGPREQSRWAGIDTFGLDPTRFQSR
jgi:hypothetical protein